jgi:UDPglucose 6-dehydrogenase
MEIYDVFEWLKVPIAIIRSALAIGTTDRLRDLGHNVVVCPEFIGEGVRPPYVQMAQPPFLILGGATVDCTRAIQCLSRLYNSECEFITMTGREAEIVKLAENYFLALKVTWANEMYEICRYFGASYDRMMGGLVHDYRIGRSHTHVYRDNRGWSSKCLNKDVPGLLQQAGGSAIAPLLSALLDVNEWHKTRSE